MANQGIAQEIGEEEVDTNNDENLLGTVLPEEVSEIVKTCNWLIACKNFNVAIKNIIYLIIDLGNSVK